MQKTVKRKGERTRVGGKAVRQEHAKPLAGSVSIKAAARYKKLTGQSL
jgi:hypothetical protein